MRLSTSTKKGITLFFVVEVEPRENWNIPPPAAVFKQLTRVTVLVPPEDPPEPYCSTNFPCGLNAPFSETIYAGMYALPLESEVVGKSTPEVVIFEYSEFERIVPAR